MLKIYCSALLLKRDFAVPWVCLCLVLGFAMSEHFQHLLQSLQDLCFLGFCLKPRTTVTNFPRKQPLPVFLIHISPIFILNLLLFQLSWITLPECWLKNYKIYFGVFPKIKPGRQNTQGKQLYRYTCLLMWKTKWNEQNARWKTRFRVCSVFTFVRDFLTCFLSGEIQRY